MSSSMEDELHKWIRIVDALIEWAMIVDSNSRIVHCNSALARGIGVAQGELIGLGLGNILRFDSGVELPITLVEPSESIQAIIMTREGTAIETDIRSARVREGYSVLILETPKEMEILQVLDQGLNAAVIINNERLIIDANQRMVDMLKLHSKSELVGHDILDFISKDHKDRVINALEMMTRGESDSGDWLEMGIVRGDGSDMLIDMKLMENRSPSSSDSRLIIAVFQDHSEIRTALKRAQEEIHLVRSYLEIAGVIFIALDRNAKITFINSRGCDVLGYSYDELIGKSWFDFVPANAVDDVRRMFHKLINGKVEGVRLRREIVTKEMGKRLIEWNTVIVKDEKGLIQGLISSGEDITELIEAQKKLEESERKYRSVIEQSLTGIVIIANDGEILFGNPAIEAFLGMQELSSPSTKEYMQRVIHPEDLDRFEQFVRTCMREGSHQSIRIRIDNEGRNIRWLELIGNRVSFLQEEVVQIVAIDITQNMKLEEAMDRQNRAIASIANATIKLSNIEDIGENLIRGIVSAYEFDGGVLRLYNQKKKCFEVAKSIGMNRHIFADKVPLDDEMFFTAYVARMRKSVFSEDIETDPEIEKYRNRLRSMGVRSLASIPILDEHNELLAILNLFNRKPREFVPDDKKFLRTLERGLSNLIQRLIIERELILSEEQLRRVMTDIDEGVIIAEFENGLIFANDKFQEIIGYDAEELAKMTLRDVIVSDDYGLIEEENVKRANGESSVFKCRMVTKNGEIRTVRVSAVPFRDKGGQIIGSISIISDLTGQIIADEMRRISELKFRKFFENLPIGVQFIEFREPDRFFLVDVNQAAVQIMSEKLEKFVGTNLKETVPPSHKEFLEYYLQVIGSGKPWHGERVIERNGEVSVAIESHAFLVLPNLLAVTVIDITERARTRREIQRMNEQLGELVQFRTAELEEANRELEAFAYSVSHDLRAPLRSVDGFSKAILEDYETILDETGKDYLHRLRAAAIRMGKMIDDILRLSRVTRVTLTRDKVNLSRIVREIMGRLQNSESERLVNVVIEEGAFAVCDKRLITIALQNLLENAWKYTRKTNDAVIQFGQRDENGQRVFFVKDNGIGFDMKYEDRLFTPFQRLHALGDFEGTGIGLSIVKRIINKHGGRIWARSSIGDGTTFFFTLSE